MRLPQAFLNRPFAHRGLHDVAHGVVENSALAFDAAVAHGYGIELDVQWSADGVPMVFHDATLDRLTDQSGRVRDRTADELGRIALTGSSDTIQPLAGILDRIAGRVPVLIELKSQAEPGFADAVRDVILASTGSFAVMSFDFDLIDELSDLDVPLGVTTDAETLRSCPLSTSQIADFAFLSHDHNDLENPTIADAKRVGAAILCWTIRSAEEARQALKVADQITFEGFKPIAEPSDAGRIGAS